MRIIISGNRQDVFFAQRNLAEELLGLAAISLTRGTIGFGVAD